MSWKALNWATDQKCRTSAAKFVLVMLADSADEQNTCFPKVSTLATKTQLGKSTVHRHLSSLVEDGQIRVLQRWNTRGGRKSNRYQLLLAGPDEPLPEHGDWRYEYAYSPAIGGDGDEDPAAEDGDLAGPDAIPPNLRDTSDQGVDTSQIERYSQTGTYEPPSLGDMNLPVWEASNKEEPSGFNPQQEPPHTPTVITAPENRGGFQQAETTPALDEAVGWFMATAVGQRRAKAEPRVWSAARVKAAIASAEESGFGKPMALAETLLVLAEGAVYGPTEAPGRLSAAGPWRRKPAPRPASVAPSQGERCDEPGHRTQPKINCPLCRSEREAAPHTNGLGVWNAEEAARRGEEALARSRAAGRLVLK